MAVRRHIERAWRSASIDHGFDEIEGPTFEQLDLYTRKSGDGIVSELFSFRRAGGDVDYALRPEFTPTLARMAAAKGRSLAVPTKWFALPLHFRAERPQRGRLREFGQWNADVLGVDAPWADAEVIAVALAGLERLGLTAETVQVRLSHRGAVGAMLERLGVAADKHAAAFELLDRRDKLPPEQFTERAAALGLDTDAVARFDAVARTARPLSDDPSQLIADLGLQEDDLVDLLALREELAASGLTDWCTWDMGIVRGLAYYTGTVFEIHERSGKERAIAGGGRYDGLIELFGGDPMPACGFGMGDVVLGLVLSDRNLLGDAGPEDLLPRPDVFVLSAGGDDAAAAVGPLLGTLRRAGLHARRSYKTTRNIGKLLNDASKSRSRSAVILGAELEAGEAVLKDLDAGTQTTLKLSELEAGVRAIATREAPCDC
jgi:histidyl-tRNA synthetase